MGYVDVGTQALLLSFEKEREHTKKRIESLIDALEDVDAEIGQNRYDSNDKASEIIRVALEKERVLAGG